MRRKFKPRKKVNIQVW